MDMWEIENSMFREGWSLVCGVDEAGRGPLAGPVYAAAVILPPGLDIPGLDDSKSCPPKSGMHFLTLLLKRRSIGESVLPPALK